VFWCDPDAVLIATAVKAVAPASWSATLTCAAFALISGYTAWCFWVGRRLVPWTPPEAWDGLKVLG
jgi:hypothetical protein